MARREKTRELLGDTLTVGELLHMLARLDPTLPVMMVCGEGGLSGALRLERVPVHRREAPQARVIGLGGSTETALAACFCEPAIIPSYWTGLPYGRPLPNTACRVVTADGAD